MASQEGSGESDPSYRNPNFQRKGSIRKVLPAAPDVDTQLSMAAKIIERRTSATKGIHGYTPFFLEYSLLAEYSLLEKQKLPGIYVIPASRSPFLWFGVMFIRQGFYQGGVFRFTINIPENYPDGECPGIVFETPIFHPQINAESGVLNVTKGFKKWRRNVNHIWHLLIYARHIFYKIDSSEPSNSDAGIMFENDLEMFRNHVSKCIKESSESLYGPPKCDDPYAIRFSEWDPLVHEELRCRIFSVKRSESETMKNPTTAGLSWVQKDSLQILSKHKTMS